MSNFDEAARNWDDNPVHLLRSRAIAAGMLEKLPMNNKMNALEYGAGTGILSLLLRDKLGHITMMDSSPEMVKVMQGKVAVSGASNLLPVCFNLENETHGQNFDLIFNQMVLHHIKDTGSIFKTFYNMLLPGGYLAIADLYPEDGSFHGEGADVHLGFDPLVLSEMLLKTGFNQVNFEECYAMKRQDAEERIKLFPIFLLIASK